MTQASGESQTTYHVMWDESGSVLRLVRLRDDGIGLYSEMYIGGEGWVKDRRPFDVMRNGQDYDVVDESEAERLASEIDRKQS